MKHPIPRNFFEAKVEKIGINPFVFIPENILEKLFEAADKSAGPIPVKGRVNGKEFIQTLVKYSGKWRLYVNMLMLKDSPQKIGEMIAVEIQYDPEDRNIDIHPKLALALNANAEAKLVYQNLSESRKKEINRYIHRLKKEGSIKRNVDRAVQFLLGKGQFIGREKP